jgi:hypothetical protein
VEEKMQKKKTTPSIHRYSLFRGTENEAVQSSASSQSPCGSISVHPESEEGRLNGTSALVTLRTRPRLHRHLLQNDNIPPPDLEIAIDLYDNININLPPPVPPPPPRPQPCVSDSSVFLNSSSSIKGLISNVEPQNSTELVNEAYGGETAPAAMLPQVAQHHHVIDPPLLSQRGPITFGTLMERPDAPLIK